MVGIIYGTCTWRDGGNRTNPAQAKRVEIELARTRLVPAQPKQQREEPRHVCVRVWFDSQPCIACQPCHVHTVSPRQGQDDWRYLK